MNQLMMTYRKLVMSGDENHAKSLFGGTLLKWADEAAVMYAMCQMGSMSVVTLKISEILFKNPAKSGDILEFWTKTTKEGTTSLTVDCVVTRKRVDKPLGSTEKPDVITGKYLDDPKGIILSCEFVFVSVNEEGRPRPWK